jgi:hypothetical protein
MNISVSMLIDGAQNLNRLRTNQSTKNCDFPHRNEKAAALLSLYIWRWSGSCLWMNWSFQTLCLKIAIFELTMEKRISTSSEAFFPLSIQSWMHRSVNSEKIWPRMLRDHYNESDSQRHHSHAIGPIISVSLLFDLSLLGYPSRLWPSRQICKCSFESRI